MNIYSQDKLLFEATRLFWSQSEIDHTFNISCYFVQRTSFLQKVPFQILVQHTLKRWNIVGPLEIPIWVINLKDILGQIQVKNDEFQGFSLANNWIYTTFVWMLMQLAALQLKLQQSQKTAIILDYFRQFYAYQDKFQKRAISLKFMPSVPKKKIKCIFENESGIDWMQYIQVNKKVPRMKEINAMYTNVVAKPMHFTNHLNWIVDQLIEDTNKEDEPCYQIKPKKQKKVESSDDEIIYQICNDAAPKFGEQWVPPVFAPPEEDHMIEIDRFKNFQLPPDNTSPLLGSDSGRFSRKRLFSFFYE